MIHIFSTDSASWLRGKKTKGLRAKPLITLLVDRGVVNKFLIDTLEGEEPIDAGNIFCIGETGDAWQQTAKALIKKYDIKDIDSDGWMVCEPKPENEVEFFEFTGEMADKITSASFGDKFVIQGVWGKTIEGVGEKMQFIEVGDFVCRQPHDHSDQWVVRRKLFNNSYTELGAK